MVTRKDVVDVAHARLTRGAIDLGERQTVLVGQEHGSYVTNEVNGKQLHSHF